MSGKDEWWISKHRLYELKHYCMQYDEWKKEYKLLTELVDIDGFDPTGELATTLVSYRRNMKLVEDVCAATDELRANDILKAVTKGIRFELLGIPVDRYFRFWGLLNKRKGI